MKDLIGKMNAKTGGRIGLVSGLTVLVLVVILGVIQIATPAGLGGIFAKETVATQGEYSLKMNRDFKTEITQDYIYVHIPINHDMEGFKADFYKGDKALGIPEVQIWFDSLDTFIPGETISVFTVEENQPVRVSVIIE